MASSVERRMALALPFFRIEILAIVMPTRSASSVTLILRFASMTSMLMMMAMLVSSHGEVMLGLQIHGVLQDPFEHRRHDGDDDRGEDNEEAHENRGSGIVVVAAAHDQNE